MSIFKKAIIIHLLSYRYGEFERTSPITFEKYKIGNALQYKIQ